MSRMTVDVRESYVCLKIKVLGISKLQPCKKFMHSRQHTLRLNPYDYIANYASADLDAL